MSKKKTPAQKGGSSGGKKTRARKAPTAIVVAPTRTVTRTRTVAVAARGSGQVARRRSVGGTDAVIADPVRRLKSKGPELVASAAYGYVTNADPGTAAGTVKSYLDKVPVVAAIGKPATHGVIATFVASKLKGPARRYMDLFATAALHRFAYNFGSKGFNLANAATVGADDEHDLAGDDDLAGAIDIDPNAGYEGEE